METYRGQGIGDGVCIGRALVVLPKTYSNEDGATAAWGGEKGWAAFEEARQRAVEALEEPKRQVFLLRRQGMSFREIGDALGKTENWARVSYFRIKEAILQRMEEPR